MREIFGFQMMKADREGELLTLFIHPEDRGEGTFLLSVKGTDEVLTGTWGSGTAPVGHQEAAKSTVPASSKAPQSHQ